MGIIVHISFSARTCGVLRRLTATTALSLALAWTSPVLAQSDAFTRSLAEASAADEAVAAFYREHRYQPLWTGPNDAARRHALIMALSTAQAQGLPLKRYDPAELLAQAKAAVTEGDRGRLEVAMTSAYLAYARDVSSGALTPKKIDPTRRSGSNAASCAQYSMNCRGDRALWLQASASSASRSYAPSLLNTGA